MSELYNRILSLCKSHGISGYKLCKATGMQPSILTDLKMGRQMGLSAKNADKIAAYFGVSVGYLLGTEAEDMQPSEKDGWYAPMRFWNRINSDRTCFMHHLLNTWQCSAEAVQHLWGISCENPDTATDEAFAHFLSNTVKAVRFDPASGEWDIIVNPNIKEAPTPAGTRYVSSDAMMFALWGDTTDMDESDLEDVRRYAAFIRERKRKK